MKAKSKKSLTIRLINNAGCVVRIALVLERRGYAIESLQMKSSSDEYTEMHLVITGEAEKFEQIQKQLAKLIDVISIKEGIREERRKTNSWTNSLTKVLSRSM